MSTPESVMESFLQFTEPFCQAILEAGYCLMDFFVLKVCGYNKATIKFAAAVFIFRTTTAQTRVLQ